MILFFLDHSGIAYGLSRRRQRSGRNRWAIRFTTVAVASTTGSWRGAVGLLIGGGLADCTLVAQGCRPSAGL